MEFHFTPDEEAFRQEVEDFVRKELPADWDDKVIYWPGGYGTYAQYEGELDEFCREFHRRLGQRGWLSLGWPRQDDGERSTMKLAILRDVMTYHRAPAGDISSSIAAPTIVLFGGSQMKQEWLPKIARGEVRFWLGYSEPNAGSDLASIRTFAREEGEEFVINGQKLWSSGAHVADYGWLIVRTDPDAPAHKGISLVIVENTSPGITIRPVINICGIHSFNEVFFDDVRVPKKNLVGEKDKGFHYLMHALQYERLAVSVGGFKRVLEELVHYVKEGGCVGREMAKDPLIRNKLAAMAIDIEVLYGLYWNAAWMMDRGRVPELEASALKLFSSELSRRLAAVGMEILGLYGQLDRHSKWAPLKGRICVGYLDSVSGSIGAGTSEIQREIIATRGLGLPR